MPIKHPFVLTALMASLMLAGCGGGSSSHSLLDEGSDAIGDGSGDTSDDTSDDGQLTIGLTDGPVESAARVVVAFTGLELKPAGEDVPALDPIVFDEASCDDFDATTGTCSIDLLQLTGETRKAVFAGDIPAGEYEWIRLTVDADRDEMDSYVEFEDGSSCPIWVPSGDETGLKNVSGITVTVNGASDYTLDFDVRSSLTAPPGLATGSAESCAQNYILKPTIRIVDTTEAVTIAGTVQTTLLDEAAACVADENSALYEDVAVYLFDKADGAAVPDDIDALDDNANPVTTASVKYDSTSDTYAYEAGYLLAGQDYLAAVTCTAAGDIPDTDEFDPALETEQEFAFEAETVVTTVAGETADGSFRSTCATSATARISGPLLLPWTILLRSTTFCRHCPRRRSAPANLLGLVLPWAAAVSVTVAPHPGVPWPFPRSASSCRRTEDLMNVPRRVCDPVLIACARSF